MKRSIVLSIILVTSLFADNEFINAQAPSLSSADLLFLAEESKEKNDINMVDRVTNDVSYNIVYDNQGAQNISFRGIDYRATNYSEDLIPFFRTSWQNSNIFNIYNSTDTIITNGAARPSSFGVTSIGGDFEVHTSVPKSELEGELHSTVTKDRYFSNLTVGSKQDNLYIKTNLQYLNKDSYNISDNFAFNANQPTNERVNSDKEYLGGNIKIGYFLNDKDEVAFKYGKSASEYGNELDVYAPDYTRVERQDLESFYGYYNHSEDNYKLSLRAYVDKYEDIWAIYEDITYSTLNPWTTINGKSVLYDTSRKGILAKADLFENGFSFVAKYQEDKNILKNKYAGATPQFVYENFLGSVLYKKTYNSILIDSALTYKKYQPKKIDYDGYAFTYTEGGSKGDILDAQVSFNYKTASNEYYLSLVKTSKIPAMGEMFAFSYYQEPNPNLKPEISYNTEIGLKHYLKTGLITTSIYNYEIKDKIYELYRKVPTKYRYYYNLNKATHRGLEFRYSNLFYNKNFLTFSYAFSRAYAEDGTTLNFIPKHKISISDKVNITPKLSTTFEYMYQSSMYDSTDIIKAYSLINLHTNYKINKDLTTTISLKNALDKNYEYQYGMPAEGRTFYASLNLKF